MNKLLICAVVAALAGSVSATLWQGDVDDLWSNGNNWTDDSYTGADVGVPTASTAVGILNPGGAAAARVDAPGAVAQSITMGKWSHPGHLVVDAAGTLETTAHILMGQEGLASSVINSGQITVGSVLYSRGVDNSFVNNGTLITGGIVLGDSATAASTFSNTGDVTINGWLHLSLDSPTPVMFNMNGGTLAADKLQMNAGGSAQLNLHGGTMTFVDLGLDGSGSYTMNVTGDGTLIANGDHTGGLDFMIGSGFITGDAGLAAVYDVGTGKTTLSVIPEPATWSLIALMGGGLLMVRRRFRI